MRKVSCGHGVCPQVRQSKLVTVTFNEGYNNDPPKLLISTKLQNLIYTLIRMKLYDEDEEEHFRDEDKRDEKKSYKTTLSPPSLSIRGEQEQQKICRIVLS